MVLFEALYLSAVRTVPVARMATGATRDLTLPASRIAPRFPCWLPAARPDADQPAVPATTPVPAPAAAPLSREEMELFLATAEVVGHRASTRASQTRFA